MTKNIAQPTPSFPPTLYPAFSQREKEQSLLSLWERIEVRGFLAGIQFDFELKPKMDSRFRENDESSKVVVKIKKETE